LARKRYFDLSFLDSMEWDSLPAREKQRRRVNGLCLKCGRALRCISLEVDRAELKCSCGFATETPKGTPLYRSFQKLSEVEA
jgi:hypothetical protein